MRRKLGVISITVKMELLFPNARQSPQIAKSSSLQITAQIYVFRCAQNLRIILAIPVPDSVWICARILQLLFPMPLPVLIWLSVTSMLIIQRGSVFISVLKILDLGVHLEIIILILVFIDVRKVLMGMHNGQIDIVLLNVLLEHLLII